MRNFSTKTEVRRNRRKPKPARAEADRSLKRQKKATTRKGGGGPKLEVMEGSQNPQGRRRTEVSESRRDPKFARTEENGSFGEQKKSKTRKGRG
jgi:hypothetical protein